ncbi:conserved hypothetical protein [Gloeothece citriformis PCC 7424]|uniref:Na+-transporting NADH:ubiquinone oxidoreductase, subunit NqrB n=1 Tax=Gloeothece citriformis (strain PCC 7424) TaxID=65393 RepID=B7KAF5_GLOC7|nr:RnfABCDGE type electron transport complex subunit D [Gloeothece citriformis]ACK72929.1 conserved hypothetical protein [Gloeothece citriformis PCC 7424]
MSFQDARNYQIIFLSVFLLLGICNRDWTVRPTLMLVIMLSCVLTQIILSGLIQPTKDVNLYTYPINWPQMSLISLRSAIITGLGLCLLLRANYYSTVVLASCLAIASKFLFRFQGKHCFNPANFGIITALIFTPDAWVSPGQWGTDWWYLLLFLGSGGMILKKVGRWDTSAVFLLTYISLETVRHFWLGWSGDVLLHQLTNGSFLLFALFMLTDPRSIPNATTGRLIWAMAVGGLTFILQHSFYLSSAIFWALFILSPLTIILDYFWSAPQFTWIIARQQKTLNPE